MPENTAIISGTWVDANGRTKRCDGVSIGVTRRNATYHIDVEESGRGSVTMTGNNGRGKFTTRSGIALSIIFEPEKDRVRYRLYDGQTQVATGIVHNLPP